MATTPDVRRVSDGAALCQTAAGIFLRASEEAVRMAGRFTVVLAGGSTPRGLYTLLADTAFHGRVAWSKVYVFFGDERHVPPDHADSNFRMANESLLSRVPIDPLHVFRIRGEYADAADAADEYEGNLRQVFALTADQLPRFDLVLLGMGADGHTASLFPGTQALHERERLVVANWIPKFRAQRITMTVPVLNHAATVMFLVQGPDKAPALKAVLEDPFEPERLPAQLVRPHNGQLLWVVDGAAASLLAPAIGKEPVS